MGWLSRASGGTPDDERLARVCECPVCERDGPHEPMCAVHEEPPATCDCPLGSQARQWGRPAVGRHLTRVGGRRTSRRNGLGAAAPPVATRGVLDLARRAGGLARPSPRTYLVTIMADERKVYWVEPAPSGSWKVKREGGSRASGTFERKSEAIAFAKEQAKKGPLGQVKIQNGKGRIEREYTYGKDPRSRKG
jgi:hypothetical protein